MPLRWWVFLLCAGVAGCATAPGPMAVPAAARARVPAEGLVIQRGILTVLGRQFTLDGYLALNAAGDRRLIVMSGVGQVLADVLVRGGTVRVIRSGGGFKPVWARRYVAADMECIFGDTPSENCPGQMLSPTHFVIQRRWYRLDLQIVEIKPGPQPTATFQEPEPETP